MLKEILQLCNSWKPSREDVQQHIGNCNVRLASQLLVFSQLQNTKSHHRMSTMLRKMQFDMVIHDYFEQDNELGYGWDLPATPGPTVRNVLEEYIAFWLHQQVHHAVRNYPPLGPLQAVLGHSSPAYGQSLMCDIVQHVDNHEYTVPTCFVSFPPADLTIFGHSYPTATWSHVFWGAVRDMRANDNWDPDDPDVDLFTKNDMLLDAHVQTNGILMKTLASCLNLAMSLLASEVSASTGKSLDLVLFSSLLEIPSTC